MSNPSNLPSQNYSNNWWPDIFLIQKMLCKYCEYIIFHVDKDRFYLFIREDYIYFKKKKAKTN